MIIALLKLLDIASRSFFVLVVLYTLPAAHAGQFGLLLTVIALYAFVCGYERYVDIQRNIVGAENSEAVVLFLSALRFYITNYVLWLPLLVLLLVYWIGISYSLVCFVVLVAVGEHLSNEFYRMAVVSNKNKMIVFVLMLKNLALLLYVVIGNAFYGGWDELDSLLHVWAFLSLLGLIASLFMYVAKIDGFGELLETSKVEYKKQCQRSYTHFRLGLLALLSLQADRLIAGSFLSLEEAGAYFRNLFLAMSAYQVMNVVSYNKIIGSVYGCLKLHDVSGAYSYIKVQRYLYLGLTILAVPVLFVFENFIGFSSLGMEGVDPYYITFILMALLLRGYADFNSMVLNGLFQERKVLTVHGITATGAALSALVLVNLYGVMGLLYALLFAGTLYLACSRYFAAQAIAMITKKSEVVG